MTSYRFCEGAVLLQELDHTVSQLRGRETTASLERGVYDGENAQRLGDAGSACLPAGGKRWETWPCATAAELSAGISCALLSKVTRSRWLCCEENGRQNDLDHLNTGKKHLWKSPEKCRCGCTSQKVSYLPNISSNSAIPLWCSVS